MGIVDVELIEESKTRYLTYALSVVNSRALPDVRDGLKPVQRRILYAMFDSLRLLPEKAHRKSAAVVGEVLARFHPHGDAACYEAMVRMAQPFSLRYPLIDGQGNFGSLDGDGAAAYRYTEARLMPFALEVIGDIGQQTVAERDNFDQTTTEPVVLPSRVPNLLVNGASGIAVGMATSIPPHNLREVIKALLILLEDSQASDRKVLGAIKGPDFPTGCLVLNSEAELREIYSTGRGPIRMRAGYEFEKGSRNKNRVIVTSIPFNVEKSTLIEKIADLAISKRLPQLIDVRDESTEEVRIVLEFVPEANVEKMMQFLYKHSPLEQAFHVNLTALAPTVNPQSGRPMQMSLRQMLDYFVEFRVQVTTNKLNYEKQQLEARIHLLEGLVKIIDVIPEVIQIVRKSEGRADGAAKLMKRFSLSELQALFIVDLRIYQLSRTSIDEVTSELNEKLKRVKEINRLLKNETALRELIAADLKRISEQFGDARKSQIVGEFEVDQVSEEEFLQHEDVYVLVTKDGWLKRIRQANDPSTSRLREGDSLSFVAPASTRDSLALFSNRGNVYVLRVYDLASTSGFGEPVQKVLKFQDGEQVVSCLLLPRSEKGESSLEGELCLCSDSGYGFRIGVDQLGDTKRSGKRIMKCSAGDSLVAAFVLKESLVFLLTGQGYGVCFAKSELPLLSGSGKGVILQRPGKGDRVVLGASVSKKAKVIVEVTDGGERQVDIIAMTIVERGKKGEKVIRRGSAARLKEVKDK